MNVGNLVLKIVDWLFAGAELAVGLNDRLRKRKAPASSGLTMRDILELKRLDDERVRKSTAPTVVIPAPSERRAIPPPPPSKRR